MLSLSNPPKVSLSRHFGENRRILCHDLVKTPCKFQQICLCSERQCLEDKPRGTGRSFRELTRHISPLENEQKASYLLAWGTGEEENS